MRLDKERTSQCAEDAAEMKNVPKTFRKLHYLLEGGGFQCFRLYCLLQPQGGPQTCQALGEDGGGWLRTQGRRLPQPAL